MDRSEFPDIGLPPSASGRAPKRGVVLRSKSNDRGPSRNTLFLGHAPHHNNYAHHTHARFNNSSTSMNGSGSNSMSYTDDYSINSFSTSGTGRPSPLFYDEGSVLAAGELSMSSCLDDESGLDADMAAIAQFKQQRRLAQQQTHGPKPPPQNLSSIPPPPQRPPPSPRRQSSAPKPKARTGVAHSYSGHEDLYAANSNNNNNNNPNSGAAKRRKLKIAAVVAVVLVVLGVVAGVVAGGGGGGSAPAAAQPHDLENQDTLADHPPRLQQVIDFLISEGWTPAEVLKNETSPQFRAAQWLADYDDKDVPTARKGEFPSRYALAVLYHATAGNDWRYRINWMSVHHACLWSATWPGLSGRNIKIGVICQDRTNVVERLFLPAMDMKGFIPPEIKLLDGLKEIDFYKNDLRGKIPSEMSQLRDLKSLILHNNYLTGPVPTWLVHSPKLETIDLAMNQLTGPLPTQLTQLSALTTLNIENNQLTGSLDPIRVMPALQFLALGGNTLTGPIEATLLTSWPHIIDLDVSDNALGGELPAILFSLDSLLVLDLHGNSFEGHLPSLVDLDAKIEFIALHENKLSGPIDHRITALANLHHLDLSNNEFTGDLPTDISDLYNLKYLFLAFNDKLTPGPIPVKWAHRLTQLKDFSLQGTKRTGNIPSDLGEMKSLVLLDLADNDLTGPIPEEIGYLRHLKFLILKENKLSGSIPESFSKLTKLDTAVMDRNDLTGGASNMCTPKLKSLVEFISDCKETKCSCCSLCCVDDKDCNDRTWFAEQDPVVNYQYSRVAYKFNEEDVIYPVPEAEEIKEHYDKMGVPGGVRARQ